MEDRPLVVLYKDYQSLWPDIFPHLSKCIPLINVPIKYPSTTHAVVLPELEILFLPSPQPAVTSDGPSRMLSQHSGALDRTSNRTPGHHTASSFDITADRKTENEDVDREDSNPLENARCSSIPVPSQGEPTPFKTLSDRPYFAIYFFSCETMEGFRTQHRKSVKLWIDKNTEQQIDWLLVLVTQVSESATQEKLIKKFCDKLRSETIGFQDSKTTKAKDRFARICTGTSAARGAVFEESWGTFQTRLRESISLSVETRYSLIEEEISHQETAGQSGTPGTDRPKARYSSVFFATEELALLHAKCGRFADAVLVYQDIDLARSPVVFPRRFRSLFKTVGFNDPGDDTPTLYNFSRKSYRPLIASNRISYFDFRSYCFARQQVLLIKLGSGDECARRTFEFIRRMSQELRELDPPTLPKGQEAPSLPRCLVWSTLASFNSANYMMARFCHIRWATDLLTNVPIAPGSPREESPDAAPCLHYAETEDSVMTKSEDGSKSFEESAHAAPSVLRDICLQLYIFGLQQIRNLITCREHVQWAPIADDNTEADPITAENSSTFDLLASLPPGEIIPLSLLTRRHLRYLLSSRESAHRAEQSLTLFILRQALDSNTHRLASMLSVTLAQWTTLQCHQYRRRKSCSTSVDDSSAVDISSPPTESSDPDVVVLSSGVNSQQNEPMSYLQLRSDIESSRQYLERCSGLVQEEDWPQLCIVARALLCEVERAAGLRAEELLSCYLLSNRKVDRLAFPVPLTLGLHRNGVGSQTRRGLRSVRSRKSFSSIKTGDLTSLGQSENNPYAYFCAAARIDYASAQAVSLITTRGVLQSKMYFKRFLKLAGSVSSRSTDKYQIGEGTNRLPSFGILGDVSRSLATAKPPKTELNLGQTVEEESVREVTMRSKPVKDVSFDIPNDNEISDQKMGKKCDTTTSPSVTDGRGHPPLNPDNSRIQLLASPNLFTFVRVQSHRKNWRDIVSKSPTPVVVQSDSAPVPTQSLTVPDILNSTAFQHLLDGFLDPDTKLPICPIDPGLSQTSSAHPIDPDVLLFLVARQGLSGPPYSRRPTLPDLYPFSEVRSCYTALGMALDQIGEVPSARHSASSNLLPTVKEERTRLSFVTTSTAVFPVNSTSQAGPRRRAQWGLKRARSIAKGHLGALKTDSSALVHGGHRWGSRLRKLNTKLMGHSTKRHTGRQRSPYIESVSELSKPNDSHSKLPPISPNRSSHQSTSHRSVSPSAESDVGTPKVNKPNSRRSLSVTSDSSAELSNQQHRRGSFPSLSRYIKSESLLHQLDDDNLSTSSTESQHRFCQLQIAKRLFLGGVDSGVPGPSDCPTLTADLGELILVHLFVYSSLCHTIPITAVVVKMSTCPKSSQNKLSAEFDAEGEIVGGVYETLHSDDAFRYLRSESAGVLPQFAASPQSLGKSVFLQFKAADILTESDQTSRATNQVANHIADSSVDPTPQTILLRPGMSLLTLRCPVGMLGRFAIDQVHLVCRACVLTQAVGDLPPLDQINQIFSNLRDAQIPPDKHHDDVEIRVPPANIPNSQNVTILLPERSRSSNTIQLSLSFATSTYSRSLLQSPNFLYGAINAAVSYFGLPYGHDAVESSLYSYHPKDMLSYFVHLPVLDLKLPTEGWFPVSVSAIEILRGAQSNDHNDEKSAVETALIAESQNILHVVIRNTRHTELSGRPRFTLRNKFINGSIHSSLCDPTTSGGSVAVWWQKVKVVAVDDTICDIICDVSVDEVHDEEYMDGNASIDTSRKNTSSFHHWLSIPQFSESIELIVPIILLPPDFQTRPTLHCWGFDCPCNTDLSSERRDGLPIPQRESSKYNGLLIESTSLPLSPCDALSHSCSLSKSTSLPHPLSLCHNSSYPNKDGPRSPRKPSQIPKSRRTNSKTPSGNGSPLCVPCPTQLQRQIGPGVMLGLEDLSMDEQAAILIPKQIHAANPVNMKAGECDGNSDDAVAVKSKTKSAFHFTAIVQFQLPSLETSVSDAYTSPVAISGEAGAEDVEMSNERTHLASLGVSDIGSRLTDMIVPHSSVCVIPGLRSTDPTNRSQLGSSESLIDTDDSTPKVNSTERPLLSFQDGEGLIQTCPEWFESITHSRIPIRQVIRPFHLRSLGHGNSFHAVGFSFNPSNSTLRAVLCKAQYTNSVDDAAAMGRQSPGALHLYGFKPTEQGFGIPKFDSSCHSGQTFSALVEIRNNRLDSSSPGSYSLPFGANGGCLSLHLTCADDTGFPKDRFSSDKPSSEIKPSEISHLSESIRMFFAAHSSQINSFVSSLGLPMLLDFQNISSGDTDRLVLQFNIPPQSELSTSQLMVEISAVSRAVVGKPAKLTIRYINNGDTAVNIRHLIKLDKKWRMVGYQSAMTVIPSFEHRDISLGLVPMQCGSLRLPDVSFVRWSVDDLTLNPTDDTRTSIPQECIRWEGPHETIVTPQTSRQRLTAQLFDDKVSLL